jgi:hypothetical protein
MRVPLSITTIIVLCTMTACTDDDITTTDIVGPSMAIAETSGRRLFDHETFGGNGRTCRTGHSDDGCTG